MASNRAAIYALVFIVISLCAVHGQLPKFVGSFPLYSVAFINVDQFNSSSPYQLVASGIGVLSGDGVYTVPDIGAALKNLNATVPGVVTKNLIWPNEAKLIPQGAVVGSPFALSVAGGFLVPTQSTGEVVIVPQNSDGSWGSPVTVSNRKDEWFYHRVRWYDVNSDGRLDIVTCRAYKPFFGSPEGQLLWLEQPEDGLNSAPWTEHVITEGPDVFFEFIDINNDTVPEIVTAEFFANMEFALYYTTSNWEDGSNVNRVVIDNTIGNAFDVRVADLNADGNPEIVGTNHEDDPTKSSVFAYEIPDKWQTEPWTKHVLASGFKVLEGGPNQATPGSAIPFFPNKNMRGENGAPARPWILVDGDGSQAAYHLRPIDGKQWDYALETIVATNATVGEVGVSDVDGDGYSEVFVPAYDTGIVYVYSYAP